MEDAVADGAGWSQVGDAGEEVARRGRRGAAGVPAEGGGERHGDGTGDSVLVAMRGDGGEARLLDEAIEIVGEEGAERGDAHGGAVAEGATAFEEGLGLALPVPGAKAAQIEEMAVHGRAVAAGGIVEVGEAFSEVLGEDFAVLAEGVQDGDGHDGVVGEGPGSRWEAAGSDKPPCLWAKEGLAEAVAAGEALEGEEGALEGVGGHGDWMIALR